MSRYINAGVLRETVDANKRDVSARFSEFVSGVVEDALDTASSKLEYSTTVTLNEETVIEGQTFDLHKFHTVLQKVFEDLEGAGYRAAFEWIETGCVFSIDWSHAEYPTREATP